MKRIVITGGHLTPALAVIKEIQKKGGWEILFFGRRKTMEGDKGVSVESRIIPKTGARFISLDAGRWQLRWTKHWLPAFFKIPLGFFQALYHLLLFQPKVILSFGGYLAAPVALAGSLLRIPIITHEQSLKPGLANRLIARLAKKVAISWKQTAPYFPKQKVVFTGNPLRQEILKIGRLPVRQAGLPVIYITGGNQGSHAINKLVSECLSELLKKYIVYHQAGTIEYYQDYKKLKIKNKKLKIDLRKRYHLEKWFDSEEAARILKEVDLVVSRAGMNIISELIYLNKPAILIPLFFSQEQKANARFLTELGLAKILKQENLTSEQLLNEIEIMLKKKPVSQAEGLIKVDAAEKLFAEIEKCGR